MRHDRPKDQPQNKNEKKRKLIITIKIIRIVDAEFCPDYSFHLIYLSSL